jgi:arylsulfatase A-like enzyme
MPARLGLSRLSAMKAKLLAAAAAAATLLLILCLRVTWHQERPCIILISIDTLRADHLGCYGYPRPTSPNIDAFAGEGVQFLEACSQAPSTAASHMSLFTGMLPPVHRVTNTVAPDMSDLKRLSPAIATLAEMLKAHGYLTAGFHGGGNVSPAFGFGRGFDRYDDRAVRWDRLWHDERSLRPIRTWLERSRRERKPLFLFLHHYVCHDPYLRAPRPLVKRFLRRPVPGLPRAWSDLAPRARPGDSLRERFWRDVDGRRESHRRHIVSLYDAGVAYADFIFGLVRRALEEETLYDPSLVVLLSDHGEEFWEHGDILHWRLFRETLHVPLLIKFPGGRRGGTKIASPVRMFDVMPTLLECAGIPVPARVQAASLLPLVRGGSRPAARVVSFSDRFDFVRFLDGDLAYSDQPSRGVGEWLFDIAADPREGRNIAGRDRPRLERLRRLAAAIVKAQKRRAAALAHGGPAAAPAGDDLRRELESLGYL